MWLLGSFMAVSESVMYPRDCMFDLQLQPTAQHHEKALLCLSPAWKAVKIQARFLLNAYSLHTIVKSKTHKSDHPKARPSIEEK